ncbi:MAG: bifunctional serine/threonine-protein kinase/formylglycine-generating enzyme family protein [Pseudomonadota bacterium]
MSNEQICDLFCALVDLSDEARDAYLERGNFSSRLVYEVQHLLSCEEAAQDFFPTSPDSDHYLTDGDVVGDFNVIGELGRGGMGVVFLAEERPLQRLVALKFLQFPNALLPDDIERLRREARVVAKLAHPSVVKVLRFGETDHRLFIAYEYIEGHDLAHMIRENKGPAGDIRKAARFLADIADALHHAHQKNIVHRDVKPSNILVDLKGRGYLTDFGLATAESESGLTRTGTVAGTWLYMSPEQALPAAQPIDFRTDIFSLGVVLYELACHRTPFNGDSSLEILRSIVNDSPTPPRQIDPKIPSDLELICTKAMQKQPQDRFQTAADMAADLRRFAEGDAISLQPPSLWDKLRTRARRHKQQIQGTLAAAMILAIGVWMGVGLIQTDHTAVVINGPPGSNSYARAFDPATGQYGVPRHLGDDRIEARLPAGFYRFVIVDASNRFAELTRELRIGEQLEIESPTLTHASAIDSLVEIPPSAFTSGFEGGPENPYPVRHHNNRMFLVSRTEITNAQFLAYMKATGRGGPEYLTMNKSAEIAHLPVVRVSWFQARDFAEWKGARLLTSVEWDRAARSTDGRFYPWGDDERLQADVCLGRRPEQLGASKLGWRDAYLENACPVGSSRDDVTEEGLTDMYGNAAEWVDTPLVFIRDDQPVASSSHRLLRGLGWWQDLLSYGLIGPLEVETNDQEQKFYFGFRIAKSADPLSTTIESVTK